MVKTVTLWRSKDKKYIFFVAGVTKRFGLGIYIDRWSFGIDVGPFWVSVEW